jgi:hypothetical protein
VIQLLLTLAQSGQKVTRTLLADTAAGNSQGQFEIILLQGDCLARGSRLAKTVVLGGAYSGSHPLYLVHVEIPQLSFNGLITAVGVKIVSPGIDGIAGFRFLNRFSYGNFADPGQFALEM